MKIACCKGLFVVGIFTIAFGSLRAVPNENEHCQNFPTYFQYSSDDLKGLSEKKSSEIMSKEELTKWDEITAELNKKNPGPNTTRMYAYLYTAQKEAAFLSYNAHGEFFGSLGPISEKVLNLFYSTVPKFESDEYSEKLAEVVYAKLKQRFDEENPQVKNYPLDENDPKLAEFPKPYIGLTFASCKSWLLNEPKQFMAAQPPAQNDPYWTEQAQIVKKNAENATESQKKAILFWAGQSGPKSGDWMAITDDYMFENNVPFSKIVYVRSLIAEAGVDVDKCLFYAKYTYLIKRPSIVNNTIKTHIPFPKHPSYPSGHSTWSPACATILTYYFPEKKDHWFHLAEEAGKSRLWAGIHYPIDHQNGWNLGIILGNNILHSPTIIPNNVFQKNHCETLVK